MLASYSSTGLAEGLKEKIIKKALKVIGKRELLYKNMDKHTLRDTSQIIDQITDQQGFSASPSFIPQSHDFNPIMFDNMCSMSDKRVNEQNQKELASERYTNMSRASSQRKKTLNSIKRQLQASKQKGNAHLSKTGLQYISSLEQQVIQEEPDIDNLRLLKKKLQEEQKAKRSAQQIIRKKAALINLNNQRVMFGYQGNAIKLQKAKQTKNQSISYLRTNIQQYQEEVDQKRKQNIVSKYTNTPINITKKINITQRQAQEIQEQQKRHKKSISLRQKIAQASTQSAIIKVNPQSHKEVQQAVSINHQGIKLTINSKNFFFQKNYKTIQPNRRITRSQYLQIKSKQQLGQYIRKPDSEYLSEDKSPMAVQLKDQSKIIAQKHAKKYKMSIKSFIGDSKSDQQKVMIHSAHGKFQLLRATTQTTNPIPTINNPKPIESNSLSKVDKYNLLYLKYKGNPPYSSFQTLNTRHQTQGSLLKSHKPSFMSIFSHKKATIRDQIKKKCKTEYD